MPAERDSLEVDVLIVGAGPAGLAAAIRLKQEAPNHGFRSDSLSVAVLEKGAEAGAHSLSGAILPPAPLLELMPGLDLSTIPLAVPVRTEGFYLLTEKHAFALSALPFLPQNRGNWIVSLNRLVRWMAGKAEEMGILIFPGFCGKELILEGGRLAGVRAGDKGISRDGVPKGNYEPGVDIRAKATVLAEGARGTLAEGLLHRFNLQPAVPQTYALGIKEVWELDEVPEDSGKVVHTLGFPFPVSGAEGGFLYCHGRMLSLGLVSPLDPANPALDLHGAFQRFKTHPFIARHLGKARLAHAGAKLIPEGGFFSIPPLEVPGGLLAGDSAGLLNSLRLKGIHLAIESGIRAADSILEVWSDEGSSQNYTRKLEESSAWQELKAVRHFQHQMRYGLFPGVLRGAWHTLLGVRRPQALPRKRAGRIKPGSALSGRKEKKTSLGHQLSLDKATTLFFSAVRQEEDQPSHLLISDLSVCRERCTREFGNPCRSFCPADVYEIQEDISTGQRYPRLHPSNCLHCKACEIADPYGIIRWLPPEGGGGPSYRNL
jgi:electron-transferring-flavoprotein dehydrogenase